MSWIGVAWLALFLDAQPAPARPAPFRITVVDDATQRGVPLVELETVNNIKYVTDSQGIVAFDEPGLFDQTVFFHVRSHGYEFPKDRMGIAGKALAVKAGGEARLAIQRINIAERLYRVTGAGIYRDSVLTGVPSPTREPLLNALVLGSDSVVNAVFRDRIHWFWGDTNQPGYPLGNFHVPGATSELPARGGLDPDRGVDLHYFVGPRGFAKETAHMPGDGPTWIGGLIAFRDKSGRERMFANYVKIRNQLETYEHGLVEFNADKSVFEKVCTFPLNSAIRPTGHPFLRNDRGTEYVVYATPYPLVRVRADFDALRDVAQYESYTCLRPGAKADTEALDRDASKQLVYSWKSNTAPVATAEQSRFIQRGKMSRDEALLPLEDVATGKPVHAHGGSVYWNAYRNRWVMIAVEFYGTSLLGEVWYAEADTPLGPWVYGRKIVTHDRYSFYNPKQHPFFDKDNGRTIYFEGTYTNSFSGNPVQTPRYDYNQLMYKLDLADSRLNLPVPFYAARKEGPPSAFQPRQPQGKPQPSGPIGFFALTRPGDGTVPVYAEELQDGAQQLRIESPTADSAKRIAFHAYPAAAKPSSPSVVPLYEYASQDGKHRAYSTDRALKMSGYARAERPICRVWKNPLRVAIPRD